MFSPTACLVFVIHVPLSQLCAEQLLLSYYYCTTTVPRLHSSIAWSNIVHTTCKYFASRSGQCLLACCTHSLPQEATYSCFSDNERRKIKAHISSYRRSTYDTYEMNISYFSPPPNQQLRKSSRTWSSSWPSFASASPLAWWGDLTCPSKRSSSGIPVRPRLPRVVPCCCVLCRKKV